MARSATRTRPVLVYDGDCGVCTRSASFVERQLPVDCELVPWQDTDLAELGLTQAECERAVQWVDVDGRHAGGHRGVGRMLVACGGGWRWLGWLALVPPTSWISAVAYRLIAANRSRLPGGTPACSLPPAERPGAGR